MTDNQGVQKERDAVGDVPDGDHPMVNDQGSSLSANLTKAQKIGWAKATDLLDTLVKIDEQIDLETHLTKRACRLQS